MFWVNIPSLTPITAPESKSSLLAYLHTCFCCLLLTFCRQKLAACFHMLEDTTARDCAVIVTTQGLVWSPDSWKNKHELTYLSLAVTCIVVLSCEMHLCGDCRSKDIIHFFSEFPDNVLFVLHIDMHVTVTVTETKWFLLSSFPCLDCGEKMVCLQAWISWEEGKAAACSLWAWSGSGAGVGSVPVQFP